jgi:hypothetical protein
MKRYPYPEGVRKKAFLIIIWPWKNVFFFVMKNRFLILILILIWFWLDFQFPENVNEFVIEGATRQQRKNVEKKSHFNFFRRHNCSNFAPD